MGEAGQTLAVRGLISDEHVQQAKEQVLNQNYNEEGWEPFINLPRLQVQRRRMPGGGLYVYKALTVVEYEAEPYFTCYDDIEFRRDWDDTVLELECIGEEEGNQVIYWLVKLPWPMANRDYVYYKRVAKFPDEGIFVSCCRSVEPGKFKGEVNGVVRVDSYVSTTAFRQVPGVEGHQLEVHCTYFDDPKGSIPQFLVNFAASKALPGMFDTFNRVYGSYGDFQARKERERLQSSNNHEGAAS